MNLPEDQDRIAAEQDQYTDTIEALRRELADYKKSFKVELDANGRVHKQLAASQAREQQLREALSQAAAFRKAMYEDVPAYMSEALALPHDDTCLRQAKAKVLRDAAKQLNGWPDGVVALNRMADELEKS